MEYSLRSGGTREQDHLLLNSGDGPRGMNSLTRRTASLSLLLLPDGSALSATPPCLLGPPSVGLDDGPATAHGNETPFDCLVKDSFTNYSVEPITLY